MINKIFACCDGIYFEKFGSAFINSACLNKNITQVHVINPTKSFDDISKKLISYHGGSFLTITQETKNMPIDKEITRTLYACERFHKIIDIVDDHTSVLVLDIDCVIRKKLPPLECAVGLYFRDTSGNDWESRGMKIAAGAVYYGAGSQYFAQRVSKKIEGYPPQWFVDQVALNEVAEEFKYGLKIQDLSKIPGYLDWDFKEDGIIWTGKGPRKYESKIYLDEVEKYRNIHV